MKTWQKYWLYFILLYSSIHFLRDIFQDLGINNVLSTIFVKNDYHRVSREAINVYRLVFNTYVLEISGFLISLYCLHRNKFGGFGYLTALAFPFVVAAWSTYYFFF